MGVCIYVCACVFACVICMRRCAMNMHHKSTHSQHTCSTDSLVPFIQAIYSILWRQLTLGTFSDLAPSTPSISTCTTSNPTASSQKIATSISAPVSASGSPLAPIGGSVAKGSAEEAAEMVSPAGAEEDKVAEIPGCTRHAIKRKRGCHAKPCGAQQLVCTQNHARAHTHTRSHTRPRQHLLNACIGFK